LNGLRELTDGPPPFLPGQFPPPLLFAVQLGIACSPANDENRPDQEDTAMRKRDRFGGSARTLHPLLAVVTLGAAYAALAFAQGNAPAQLPNGPAKPGFDIGRFSSNGGLFKTFDVQQTEPLQKILKDGRVAKDTPVLVTATAAGNLALLTDQMVFHHLAQGRAGGKDWMAAF
jgi:hypothetical protein